MSSSKCAPVIAVDVGGTFLKGAIVEGASITSSERWSTGREHGSDQALEGVIAFGRKLAKENPQAKALGIVVPGLVDEVRGISIFAENVGWRDVPFRQLLEDATGLPVGFGHDVRAGGLAEKEFGAGVDVENFLFLPIGTGISGAIFVNGEIVTDSLAGELGHIEIGSGEKCTCGGANCLETVATGASIARRYTERTGNHVEGAAQVLDLVKAGDPQAISIWDEALEGLARVLTMYISILPSELIIIGGGVSMSGEELLGPLREKINGRSLWQRKPKLSVSHFGDNSAVIGAAILARRVLEGSESIGSQR
ncbi:MAG TPA: ROK family protein [Candidatus Nanopelagicaceae bacterium]|jgi:glucokinase